MRLAFPAAALAIITQSSSCLAFTSAPKSSSSFLTTSNQRCNPSTILHAIGLGPSEKIKAEIRQKELDLEKVVWVGPGPRDTRQSSVDLKTDAWYAALLGDAIDNRDRVGDGMFEDTSSAQLVSQELFREINEPDVYTEFPPKKPTKEGAMEYGFTRYYQRRLPDTPWLPPFGIEKYGIVMPRRGAEAWKQFDLTGLVQQEYQHLPESYGMDLELSEKDVKVYRDELVKRGVFENEDEVSAQLVYVNGRFAPQLSIVSEEAYNLKEAPTDRPDLMEAFARLPDGFTDAMPTEVGEVSEQQEEKQGQSIARMSWPHHNVGPAASQFAINNQQGMACFAALNTLRTKSVTLIDVPAHKVVEKPIVIINAVSRGGGAKDVQEIKQRGEGVSFHPRLLVNAMPYSKVSIIQSSVDLFNEEVDEDEVAQENPALYEDETFLPKFYNGYTQLLIRTNATVQHSYVDETGGKVTPNVESQDKAIRTKEANRAALKNAHFEVIDAHLTGGDAVYKSTVIEMGGNGRNRIGYTANILQPNQEVNFDAMVLTGGVQKSDIRTTLHHAGYKSVSKQQLKFMVGGRSTLSFRGRIRIEDEAQQTDADQLSRTLLLTDKARLWAIPSLEIAADDVKCTHGCSVSDLSDEELFYFRSRGINNIDGRKLQMYGFVRDVARSVDPVTFEKVKDRVFDRLNNIVYLGKRAIKQDFASI